MPTARASATRVHRLARKTSPNPPMCSVAPDRDREIYAAGLVPECADKRAALASSRYPFSGRAGGKSLTCSASHAQSAGLSPEAYPRGSQLPVHASRHFFRHTKEAAGTDRFRQKRSISPERDRRVGCCLQLLLRCCRRSETPPAPKPGSQCSCAEVFQRCG